MDAIEFSVVGSTLMVATAAEVAGMKIFAPKVEQVTVGGREHDFTRDGDHVILK